MRGGTNSQGYTILEVMIFLAVSGFMFVLAAGFINGKQSSVEFKQGINALNTQIQSTINDVQNGYFPGIEGYTCTAPGTNAPQITQLTSSEQGTNLGCVFLGKFIQLGDQAEPNTAINTYTVAGRQLDATGNKVASSFAESKPTTDDILRSRKVLPFGLEITKITSASSGSDLTGVGFFTSIDGYDASSNLISGSQSTTVVQIVASPATARNQTNTVMKSQIASQITDANVLASPNITICVTGGNNRYGTITIGDSQGGQRLATTTQISNAPIGNC